MKDKENLITIIQIILAVTILVLLPFACSHSPTTPEPHGSYSYYALLRYDPGDPPMLYMDWYDQDIRPPCADCHTIAWTLP